MWSQALTVLLTAGLSSLFTVAAGYVLYRKRLQRELEERLAAAREELEETLSAALEGLGDVVEERVRQGVVKGVASIPSTEVLSDTTKSVAKTGADLAERGLRALLGNRRRRSSEE